MGKGIDMAALHNPELAKAIDDMKDQLILVLIRRLGSHVTIPVQEIDSTSGFILTMEARNGVFVFDLIQKH